MPVRRADDGGVHHGTPDFTECERERCRHELARGVTVADLWAADGPYPTTRFDAALRPAWVPRVEWSRPFGSRGIPREGSRGW